MGEQTKQEKYCVPLYNYLALCCANLKDGPTKYLSGVVSLQHTGQLTLSVGSRNTLYIHITSYSSQTW